jgi:hypothetical protein
LKHWKEQICDNDEVVYQYVLRWIKNIVANPIAKNEVALILKSLQGTGKTNLFTNIICDLLGVYSEPNMNSVDDIIGKFNHIRTNKELIV